MIARSSDALPVWKQAQRQRELEKTCKHHFRWDRPRIVESPKGRFPSWMVKGECRHCGFVRFAKTGDKVELEPLTREADAQGIKILNRYVRFVPISEPEAKYPPLNGWPRKAKTDLVLAEVLSDRYLSGMMNYATVPRSRVICIDVDNEEAYDRCNEVEGFKTRTLRTRTPRGQHLWFRLPKGKTLGPKRGTTGMGPGVDIVAAGGYAVGIGGYINPRHYTKYGKPLELKRYRYQVLTLPEGNDLPEIPEPLLARIEEPPPHREIDPANGRCTAQASAPGNGGSSAWRGLVGFSQQGIIEGERDSWVFGNAAVNKSRKVRAGEPVSPSECVEEASRLNALLADPLPSEQIAAKGKTIQRWAGKLADGKGGWTREQQAKGGRTRRDRSWTKSLPRDLEAWRLNEGEGLSAREIGERLGVHHETAGKMIQRGSRFSKNGGGRESPY